MEVKIFVLGMDRDGDGRELIPRAPTVKPTDPGVDPRESPGWLNGSQDGLLVASPGREVPFGGP